MKFDVIVSRMGKVKYYRFLKRYLKKTGRLRTLKELNLILDRKNSNDRKPVSLSFTIQKAPERKILDVNIVKKARKKRKEAVEDDKTLIIPTEFRKVAKTFGLPEEHLDFFYENRDSFHWEKKEAKDIHCSHKECQFTVKESKGCLIDHMNTVHGYSNVPCGKPDCSYLSYSKKNLNMHRAVFHGHGKKADEHANFTCPYSSCKASFRYPSLLQRHLNIHENRMVPCYYCPYKNGDSALVHDHLYIHFDIRKFVCDICSKAFHALHSLRVHENWAHGNSDLECVDCKYVTSNKTDYKKHRKSCHERLKHSRIL